MAEPLQVAQPPTKPLLLFDNDCNFCRFWVERWRHVTGDRVEYLPGQDPSVRARFPELTPDRLSSAVQLVQPDGRVDSGAAAVFRALAATPGHGWPLWLYTHLPGATVVTEALYSFVAQHRQTFSIATRLLWGTDSRPDRVEWARWLFLRGLGLIYLAAFVSLWLQLQGLIGSHGIVPAHDSMNEASRYFNQQHLTFSRYHYVPTWFWISSSDQALRTVCGVGTSFSILLVAGVAPTLSAFALWTLYLSLAVVGREFLSFQWDVLLLETGFLAIFFAPLEWLPGVGSRPRGRAPRLVLWLLRWLVFRLMFESGCVKLLSHDPTWLNLTALHFHFETQPLPTWIGWYNHQCAPWFLKTCTALLFGIELGLPFFVFGPRRLRFIAAFGFTLLQSWILLTGNYGFFNYLSLVLCLLLLDDRFLERSAKAVLARFAGSRAHGPPPALPADAQPPGQSASPAQASRPLWPPWILRLLATVILLVSLLQLLSMFQIRSVFLQPLGALTEWLAPFRSINSYGLFAVMTTSRMEIVVEGSNDRKTWQPYLFRYKPGPLKIPPRFVAPFQPRLDWQMWFAALGSYRENPWFINFCVRLLQGSPEVTHLLEGNPFPKHPPQYIHAVVYEYHFSTPSLRQQTGAWWTRKYMGEYLPAFSLRDVR